MAASLPTFELELCEVRLVVTATGKASSGTVADAQANGSPAAGSCRGPQDGSE